MSERIEFTEHVKNNFNSSETELIHSYLTKIQPGTTPLAPVMGKLRMAYRRKCELEWTLWAYLIDTPYKVVSKSNAAGTEHGLYVEFKEEPDFILWGNLLGEFAYNLRSGLDQLIYILSIRENGGEFPRPNSTISKMPGSVKFPIFTLKNRGSRREHGFYDGNGGGQSCLGYISNVNVLKAIENVQPCNTHPDDPEENPFWIINELCNTDKHREVVPVLLRTQFDYFEMRGGNAPIKDAGVDWETTEYRGQPDAKVGNIKTRPGVKVDIDGGLFLQPAIEAVKSVSPNTFSHRPDPTTGNEMVLPQLLYTAVMDLVKKIGDEMGWDENLVRFGIPKNSTEEVLPRTWLPGRSFGTFQPFAPTDLSGKPIRRW